MAVIGGKRELERTLSLVVFIFFLACLPVYLFVKTPEQIDLFGNLVQFLGLAFIVFCFFRARIRISDLRVRQACLLFSFGFSFWAFGQLFVLYSETLLHRISTGTVSSAYFLIGYSFVVGGLYRLARDFFDKDPTGAFKSALITCVVTLIMAAIVCKPVLSSHRETTYMVLNITYGLFDLIAIGIAFFLFQLAWSSGNKFAKKAYALFLSGFLIIGISNFIGMYVEFGTVLFRALDLLYFSSYFLLSMSGALLPKAYR